MPEQLISASQIVSLNFKGESKLFDLLKGYYISKRSQTQECMLNYPTYIRHKKWAKLLHLLKLRQSLLLRRTQWLQEMGKDSNEKKVRVKFLGYW